MTSDRAPVSAAEPAAVVRKFREGGVVHVTGACDPALLGRLRSAAETIFEEWAADAASGALAEHLEAPLVRRFVPLSALPASLQDVEPLIHPSVREVARGYLGREPEIDVNSHIRSILLARVDAHLPFHQDESILDRRLVNVWIPLDSCGVDAPGLDLIWGSWRELLQPSPPSDAMYPVERARLDATAVEERFGPGAHWRPVFRPGDAMVFSGATIHRTHVTPAMRRDRMSIEIRLL